MKFLKFFFLPLFFAASFSSCKKCTTCEAKDSSGNVIYPSTETCGNKDELDKARLYAKQRAMNISGTYTCTEK